MHKRLWTITIIIFLGLVGLCVMGFYSINLHSQALAAKRYAEFADVAEQIRGDIKNKLDIFIDSEQKRAYTDYQYYYIPQSFNEKQSLLRSPLADTLQHGLAYGHFQIEPDSTIITPFYRPGQNLPVNKDAQTYIKNIQQNLLAALNGNGQGTRSVSRGISLKKQRPAETEGDYRTSKAKKPAPSKSTQKKAPSVESQSKMSRRSKRKSLSIKSLDEKQRQTQVVSQKRATVLDNFANNAFIGQTIDFDTKNIRRKLFETQPIDQLKDKAELLQSDLGMGGRKRTSGDGSMMADMAGPMGPRGPMGKIKTDILAEQITSYGLEAMQKAEETIQIRIEPFVPIIVPSTEINPENKLFPEQVFLLRHVQIEDRHFMQGFRLNQIELLKQLKNSASTLLRRGMGFELSTEYSPNAAYSVMLDFGFAEIVLNMFELDPGWIKKQTAQLHTWYYAIVAMVFIAVAIALLSLWRNVNSQIKLAGKKDDFISAVSHELRTPLTSIRMYSEMLEKGWVSSDSKRSEYYTTMRQESERLTRLIENVLDFSRIQRGKKTYAFKLGNINDCIGDVIDMMSPYAAQTGFNIAKDFGDIDQVAFDNDAVMQIVINLIDNSIKFAKSAKDKTIIVRTRKNDAFITIEVEDHGPGLPHREHKKVFDEFYRCQDESTRQTTGTGLGLALVKKFAQAHQGFVEIFSAKPKGTIVKVTIPTHH